MPDPIIKLKTSGLTLTSFDALTVQRDLDAFADSFSFTTQNRPDILKSIKPRGYQPAEVWFGEKKVITGTIEKHTATMSSGDLNLEGRSKTGVMLDSCMPPAPGYTLSRHQWGGLTLGAVAKILAKPFGVTVSLPDGDTKPLTDPTVSTDGDKPGDWLQNLAHDKGWVFNADGDGQLELLRPDPNAQVMATIEEGKGSFLDCNVSVDSTAFFSQFLVVDTAGGFNSVIGNIKDPGVPVYRASLRTGSNQLKELETAAKWDRASAYANAFGVSLEVGDWTNNDGLFWEPGLLVSLLCPSCWIFKTWKFMIAGVTYRLSSGEGRKATLRLVLPETYTGEVPKSFPWD